MVGAFTWTTPKRKRGQPESGKESRFYFKDGVYTPLHLGMKTSTYSISK